MKKLGCTLCILVFFNLQLTESAEISEQKDENKNKKTHSHPSFFIFQLTVSADIIEVKDEKAMLHIVHPSFSYFSSLRVLKSVL